MRLSLEELMNKYQRNLYTAAYNICCNAEDANDAVQDTFIKYYSSSREFEDEAHIRAWLLRVVINRAKDIAGAFWRKNRVSLEDASLQIPFEEPEDRSLFEAVMQLPEKLRTVVHLYYYENYQIKEIAGILRISEGSAKMRLSRARSMLKQILQEDEWSSDGTGRTQERVDKTQES